MKTLFFCNLFPRKTGAFERVLAELGRVHASHGDRLVMALAGAPIPAVAEWFREAGVEWRVISSWNGTDGRVRPWGFVGPALRLIREIRPDVGVVHFGNELPSLAVSLLAPVFGRRGVKWVWQQDQQMVLPGKLASRLSRARLLGLRFDRFVVVYEEGRDSLIRRSIPAARVQVVYNGVVDPDPARQRGRIREQLGVDEQTPLLMCVGSMIPRKRQEMVIKAFAACAPDGGASLPRLMLIGDGPERLRLEKEVRDLGLQERVIFLGVRNDVSTLLCGADVMAHAAVAEGCAYVLAEAMAAGLPLVVTAAGAAREQVEDGVNGFVVEGSDRRGFEQQLARLVGDAALRRRMGAASRQRWERLFRLEQQAQAYWEIYRGMV